jgi:hypothetical protein
MSTREEDTITSLRLVTALALSRTAMVLHHSLGVACILSLALVVVADASLGMDAAATASGDASRPRAPDPPEPRTLEQELFACRVACHAEPWDPVCVDGTVTYANACWASCATPLSRSEAGTSPGAAKPGRCERERSPDEKCISGCVDAWGEENKSTPAFGWRPVCGEDGVTYTTSCFAGCSGVISTEGECHDVDPRRRR